MEPDEPDQDQLVTQLVNEILVAVDQVGELKSWVVERLDGPINDAALHEACTQVAEQFLSSTPPQTGFWEHLLLTLCPPPKQPRSNRQDAAVSIDQRAETARDGFAVRLLGKPSALAFSSLNSPGIV
jgi:hypothetical protein